MFQVLCDHVFSIAKGVNVFVSLIGARNCASCVLCLSRSRSSALFVPRIEGASALAIVMSIRSVVALFSPHPKAWMSALHPIIVYSVSLYYS